MSGSHWRGPLVAENGFRIGDARSSVPLISQFSGNVYYVDSVAGSDTYDGTSWVNALATLDAAVGKCTANNGDMIYVAAGHAESLTAKVTLDIAGVTVVGLGNGNNRPAFTVAGAIDGLDITAADVHVENLRFPTPSAAATAMINIAAARAAVRKCRFELGANAVDPVTVTADGERPLFEYNEVQVTADGPDEWIIFEGVVDQPVIRHNLVIGSDGTNAFDVGVIEYNSQAVTNPMVYGNSFEGQGVATTVVANNASVVGELMGPNTYAGSATSADNVSSQQELVDALYGAAGIATFPAGAAAANAVSIAEVLRYLQENVITGTGTALPANSSLYGVLAGATGIATFPNAAVPANDVSLAEVIRDIWAALQGTAAGENGVQTWPAAAAPANNVSIAEAVRWIVEKLIATASGTAQAGAAGTITLAAGASATDDFYNGMLVLLTGGTGAGQSRLISDYVGATKVANVEPAWATTPDNTSTYAILPGSLALSAIGADNANNDFASTNVAANKDGTLLERLEDITQELSGASGLATFPAGAAAANAVSLAEVIRYIQENIITGTGTALPANQSLYDVLAGANGIATWAAAAAPANNVSLAEAIRYIVETQIGTITNTGGTATVGAVLGDLANDSLVARLNDVGSNVDSATTDNLQGKIGTDTELADRSVFDLLAGDGPAAYPAAAAPANDVSLAEVLRELYNQADKSLSTVAAVMANGDTTIFTIAGGPIEVLGLLSVCVTANDITGSTLQYQADPTDGGVTALSIASASLASATAGTTALCTGTFGAAPTITANGTVAAGTTKFVVPAGIIKITIATGPTTGTWTHHLRYRPLARGVTVS